MSSKLAGDWIVARSTKSELDTATSLAAFDSAWKNWEPQWEASHLNPKDAKDSYFTNTFSPRAYDVLTAARNNEVERIVSRIKGARHDQSLAQADSALLTSRCFDQLDFALSAKDGDFAVRLALSHAKECTARLYSELRAAHQ